MDELMERLNAVIVILEEMDNAATPDLVEAVALAKDIITKDRRTRDKEKTQAKERQLDKERQKLNDELVKFSAAFDDVFEEFLLQLFRKNNRKDDKRFKK